MCFRTISCQKLFSGTNQFVKLLSLVSYMKFLDLRFNSKQQYTEDVSPRVLNKLPLSIYFLLSCAGLQPSWDRALQRRRYFCQNFPFLSATVSHKSTQCQNGGPHRGDFCQISRTGDGCYYILAGSKSLSRGSLGSLMQQRQNKRVEHLRGMTPWLVSCSRLRRCCSRNCKTGRECVFQEGTSSFGHIQLTPLSCEPMRFAVTEVRFRDMPTCRKGSALALQACFVSRMQFPYFVARVMTSPKFS